jgi:hypothetical protein
MSNILTTRNVVGVTYKIDEILTPDQQAEVLTDIYSRLAVREFTFDSQEAIDDAILNGVIVKGQFVILLDKFSIDTPYKVVVAKFIGKQI